MSTTADHLPLLIHLLKANTHINLENVKIIACQHLMESTLKMFLFLKDFGLSLHNVFLLGKCYSTNREIMLESLEKGIHVSSDSLCFDSHSDFDSSYKTVVSRFFNDSFLPEDLNNYKKVIFLDDGGYLIQLANSKIKDSNNVFGIEQTSSGYLLLKNENLHFPLLNVARSPVKLIHESPMIVFSAFNEMIRRLQNINIPIKKVLVIGAGAIGIPMYHRLKEDFFVDQFDIKNHISTNIDFISSLKKYDALVGCTGVTSIPGKLHSQLNKNCVLVSVSSSDREFDAVHLRRKSLPISDCHQDMSIDGITLLNAGFPINFFGSRNNISLDSIQLTLALLTSAIFQGCGNDFLPNEIIPLDPEIEREITAKFLELSNGTA